MTHLRGSRAAYRHLSNDLRQRPSTSRAGERASLLSTLSRRRLLEIVKPWLIVGAFLLLFGLVGGLETGTVWP